MVTKWDLVLVNLMVVIEESQKADLVRMSKHTNRGLLVVMLLLLEKKNAKVL